MRLSLSPFQRQLFEWLQERDPPRSSDTSEVASAAVAVIIVPNPDAVLIIRRAERVGDPWSGHMGLPGGRRQSSDADALATAIRETHEEVGVRLIREWCLGALDLISPRSASAPRTAVQPFVFALADRTALSPNHEVSLALWLPILELPEPGPYRPVAPRRSGAGRICRRGVWRGRRGGCGGGDATMGG